MCSTLQFKLAVHFLNVCQCCRIYLSLKTLQGMRFMWHEFQHSEVMWVNSTLQDINARSVGRTLNKALEDFTIAGCIISMLGLILTIVTMVGFKWEWPEPKNTSGKSFQRKIKFEFLKGIQTCSYGANVTVWFLFWRLYGMSHSNSSSHSYARPCNWRKPESQIDDLPIWWLASQPFVNALQQLLQSRHSWNIKKWL